MYPFRLFEYVLNTLKIHPEYALNTMYSEVAPRYTTDTLGYTADTMQIHQIIHAKYTCIRCVSCKACKGYQHSGICSHILAVNHIQKQFNVRAQLVSIGKGKSKGRGGDTRPHSVPALMRVPQREPDSSDEEDERLLQLGMAGK